GVGRGYLGDVKRTAQSFVPDPFLKIEDRGLKIEDSQADAPEMRSSILYPLSSHSGRLYRTGDQGRYRADGNIEFLGRNDHQIKLRGFRIELGEIEARLAEHPGVREAVVLAREDSPGDMRLVGYYTAGEEVAVEELRGQLASRLPEYMVPAAYV